MTFTQTILELLTTEMPLILALTLGVVEVFKRIMNWHKEENAEKKRFLPLVSVIIGIIFGLLIIGLDKIGFILGLIGGLGASGLWDFGSSTISLVKGNKE